MVQQSNYNIVEEVQRLGTLFGVKHADIGMDEEKMEIYLKDGKSRVNGLANVTIHIASKSNSGKHLLGKNLEEDVLVSQWLEFRNLIEQTPNLGDLEPNLNSLNQYLSNKVYLVGHRLTLADVSLCLGLHPILKNLSFQEKEGLPHLSRWFDLVQHSSLLNGQLSKVIFSKTQLYSGTKKH